MHCGWFFSIECNYRVSAGRELRAKKIANSTSNGQNQRDLIEWIGVIHLPVCVFGLLKNCNDLGVNKVNRLISCVESLSCRYVHRACGIHAARIIAGAVGADQCNGPLSPCSHKGHNFCKNFTKYSVPSLGLGWNMIFNMLHKCWWLLLVWNLRLLKSKKKRASFSYATMYYRTSACHKFPLHGEISRMRTS